MTEFIFYILKINLLAACGILVVILAGKALAEKYLPGWKVFLWLVFSVTLLIPVNLSSTTGIWRMQIPMREDQERQAEIVIPQQGIVPESDSVQESQAYVLETGSPQSQVLSEKGTEQQETSAAVSEQRRPPIRVVSVGMAGCRRCADCRKDFSGQYCASQAETRQPGAG